MKMILAAAFLLLALAVPLARWGVRLGPHHAVLPSRAQLDPDLERSLLEDLAKIKPSTVPEAIQASLRLTGKQFHFGLRHHTTLVFGIPAREGNCVEYAQLFLFIFKEAEGLSNLQARARAVRSEASLWGYKIPSRAWNDHDWVLIEEGNSGKRWYVDPTMFGAHLGWNLEKNICGEVLVPR